MTANDNELLGQYVRNRSEAAFGELVRRHIRLVYSAALRQVNGDRPAAEDVAQSVFTDLARKAPRLLRHTSLTGWLYTSTRFEAGKIRRSAQRRVLREHAAHAMNEILLTDSMNYDWTALRPLLDDAMDELNSSDREVVLWRYFEERPLADIGLRLGVKENAARMRVERALDKLRASLAKRGITSSAVALAAALAAHAMEEVPPAFAERVFRTSVAAGAGGGLAWMLVSAKAKLIAGALGLLAIGGVVLLLRPHAAGTSDDFTTTGRPTATTSREPQASASSPAADTSPNLDAANAAQPNRAGQFEFRLTLLAAESSRPITDGEVSCRVETRSGSETRKLRSNANGLLRFEIPDDVVDLELVTAIEGFADTRLAWRRDRGELVPHEYLLKLTPGVELGGYVVDATNRPVSGAKVATYVQDSTAVSRPESHVTGYVTVETDKDGKWRTSRVAPELVRGLTLSATHPDFATGSWLHVGVEADAEQQLRAGLYTFRLSATATVVGFVIDPGGNPISGATVRIGGLYDLLRRATQSGPDGWFSLPGKERGNLSITGEADGFAPTTIQVGMETNQGPVRLVLERGAPLNVRVVDRGGHPVAKANVGVEPDLEHRGPDGSLTSQVFSQDRQTDDNGVAEFAHLPEYDLWVGVTARGFIGQGGINARAGGPELVVNLISNLAVSGTVRDATTKELIPQFRIVTGKPDAPAPYFSSMDRFVLSFAGGKFQHTYDEAVTLGPNRGYLLRFEADGYAPFVSRLIAPDEGSVQLDVSLRPATLRHFSVLNPDGTRAVWADVGLLDRAKGNSLGLSPGGLERFERSDGALQQTDGQGAIKLPADDEHHWIVVANQSGYLATNLDGVADGGSIRLQPWGRIEGTLPEPEKSRPNQEIWIQYVRNPQDAIMAGASFHVAPDQAGHFILPKVPPNPLRVFVGTKMQVSENRWVWSSSRIVQSVDVRPGETTEVTFGKESDAANSALSE